MERIFGINRLMTVLAAALLTAAVCLAQVAPAKKALMFHGKVEAVNEAAKSLKVNGEKVEGWMDAMTMDYKVEDPAILKKLKAGDQIMATVYEGDMVLHKVEIMPTADKMKSKK
ncbi:MAG: copper-binding protein [Bryobacteraceae bacterium]